MKLSFSRVLLSTALVAAACGKAPAPPAEAPKAGAAPAPAHDEIPDQVKLTAAAIAEAGITTWKVQPVDLAHLLVLTGSVGHNENRLVQLAANVRGRVSAIPVDLGARVRKGDPVLEIESVDLGRARQEIAA